MPKPVALPIWDRNEVNVIEPDTPHKNEGWLAPGGIPEKPPFQFFNHWQNNVYKWIQYFNEGGVPTYDTDSDYVPGSVVIGGDLQLYTAYSFNGPSTAVVNPVGDGTGVWCFTLIGLPGDEADLGYVPTATRLTQMRLLPRDGSSVLDADYPGILTAWGGKIYGNIDGTHFYLPDDRGRFPRMWDNGAGVDPDAGTRTDRGDGTTGDNVGTLQGYAVESHIHASLEKGGTSFNLGNSANYLYNNFTAAYGGNETRPINRYKFGGIHY